MLLEVRSNASFIRVSPEYSFMMPIELLGPVTELANVALLTNDVLSPHRQNGRGGGREKAQWVKCLLCKHEHLSLDPSTHVKTAYDPNIIARILVLAFRRQKVGRSL